MKVGINARIFSTDETEGVGYFGYEITKRLLSQYPDLDWTIYTHKAEGKVLDFIDEATIRMLTSGYSNHVSQEIWRQRVLPKAMVEDELDLFISYEESCTLRTSVPQVICLHDLAYLRYPEAIKWRWLMHRRIMVPYYIQKAKEIITVSDFSKSEIEHFFPSASPKLRLTTAGVKPPFFDTKKDLSAVDPYYVVIGSVHPRKRVDLAILAFEKFYKKHPESRLVIIGNPGWQTRSLERLYEKSPAKSAIKWTGYLSVEDVADKLSNARGLLFMTDYEGLGVPTLEAMATRTKVICQNIGAMAEVAGDYANYATDQTESIVKAMEAIHKNPEIDSKQEAIRVEKLHQYTWDNAALPYFKIIEERLK